MEHGTGNTGWDTKCQVQGHDHDMVPLRSYDEIPGRRAAGTYYECPTGNYRFLWLVGNAAPIRYKRPRFGWRS
jgi:hypothetical protein